jgi:hypothetical protein
MSNEEILDSMDANDYEYAIASQISYSYYDNNNDAEATQRILDNYIEGYKFDKEYSYNNGSTIVRPDGSAILAYRGTRPTNLDDLNADASILAGQHRTNIPHPRFIEANNHYQFVKNKYPNLDITGHSLGGTIADYVARQNEEKAVVFNPGETPFSSNIIGESNTRIYRTNTHDLVSFSNSMYPHAKSIRVVPQTDPLSSWLGSHNLSNFLPRQDLLPISKEPDIIIPTIKTKIAEEKIIEQRQINICKEMPYLEFCKRLPKLKKKVVAPVPV